MYTCMENSQVLDSIAFLDPARGLGDEKLCNLQLTFDRGKKAYLYDCQ